MMLSDLRWLFLPAAAALSLEAAAIKLDCKDLGDGTYTCVEIKESYYIPPDVSKTNPAADAAPGNPYIEAARKHCTYQKPRVRKGGGGTSIAAKMEAQKRAQEDYDRCIVEKAWELKNEAEQQGEEAR